MQKNTNRILWIDYSKGIGIFLVVLGHLNRSFINANIMFNSPMIDFIDRWIYAFHMPLFFFLSGLFFYETIQKQSLNIFIIRKIKTIAYPYIIWSIFQGILQIKLKGVTNNQITWGNIFAIWYQPIMQFWFLYSLFGLLIIYAIIFKIIKDKAITYFLLISIIFYVANWLNLPKFSWSVLNSIWQYSLYFSLGVAIGKNNQIWQSLKNLSNFKLCILSLFGFFILTLGVYLQWTNLSKSPLFAIIGVASVIALSIFIEKLSQNFTLITQTNIWGLFSLEIFLIHTISSASIRIILQKLMFIDNVLIHYIWGMLGGIYLPILFTLIIRHFQIKYVFEYP